MVERYQAMIAEGGGQVHRHEDWGRRQLAHPINKVHKAHYIMLNIECDKPVLDELLGSFRFNDAVLRHLVVRRNEAVTEASPMAKAVEDEKRRDAAKERRSYDRVPTERSEGDSAQRSEPAAATTEPEAAQVDSDTAVADPEPPPIEPEVELKADPVADVEPEAPKTDPGGDVAEPPPATAETDA